MNTKPGFRIHTVCGEKILIAEGVENIDFSCIISMNEPAAFLWEQVEGTEFTLDDLTNLLVDNYDVDEATARTDAAQLVEQWKEADIVEG